MSKFKVGDEVISLIDRYPFLSKGFDKRIITKNNIYIQL